jgi:hypothetical protein
MAVSAPSFSAFFSGVTLMGDSTPQILRLSIKSPFAGRLVFVEFLGYVEEGAETWCEVDIYPCDARGVPEQQHGPQRVVLRSVDDEVAYARYNTMLHSDNPVARLMCDKE